MSAIPPTHDANVRSLLDALKQVLRMRGLTYTDIARELGVSLPTVKRQLSRGDLSLDRLLAICALAEVDLHELARASRHGADRSPYLDMAQEQALAASEPMMLVFHLLLAGRDLDDIRHDYQFHPARLHATLEQLQAIKLLTVPRRGPPRLRVPAGLIWRRNGPVMRRYGAAAMQEFLRAEFGATDEWLAMETRELTQASRLQLRRRLDQVQQEFLKLAELDVGAPTAEKRNTGLILALRPWTFSIARARART